MSVTFVPEKTRISVERYQKMVAAGVLTERDRIELIDGEMINKASIGPKHAALTARLTKVLVLAVGDAAIVSPGGPVNLGTFQSRGRICCCCDRGATITREKSLSPPMSYYSSKYPIARSPSIKAPSERCTLVMA